MVIASLFTLEKIASKDHFSHLYMLFLIVMASLLRALEATNRDTQVLLLMQIIFLHLLVCFK